MDAIEPYFFRDKPTEFHPDFIRMDRALLYIREQIPIFIREIESKSTKTVGEYSYRIHRFGRELISLARMAGQRTLIDRVYPVIMGINSRTPRVDAIARLKEVSTVLESYEVREPNGDVEQLRERIEELETRLDEKPQSSKSADVADERVVFIIMPFSPTFNDVWKGAIQRAATELGLKPIRADMINRSSNITDDIVESIKNCHLAIVDVWPAPGLGDTRLS